jgi:carbamoyl-phosphate synthase small subunit
MIAEVSTKEVYVVPAVGSKQFVVAAMDFGIKSNLIRELTARGCEVHMFPAQTTGTDLLRVKPDGIFLSNGPGDPEAAPYAVQAVREVLGKVPLFGVCMGHQILGLALGAKTFKLKFGHRGGNQPVSVARTGRVEISSHNHGYAVNPETLPSTCEVTHINLNDKTLEGFRVPSLNAFSVQFHPEACPGPHDSVGLFNEFVEMMRDPGEMKARVPKVH